MVLKGKVWKYGDNIDTDVIIPARFLTTNDIKFLREHCMEDIDPGFSGRVEPGDIMVAGKNFGCGSSREQAPMAIKAAGISCVIASSFARIFFRNAINTGLPILQIEHSNEIDQGDVLEIDLGKGFIRNLGARKEYRIAPLPDFLQGLFRCGGLMNYVKAAEGDQCCKGR